MVALAKVKDDLSRYLRLAGRDGLVITRHGRPAGMLIGFASEDEWLEYRLEHDPEFLDRIAEARAAFKRGEGVRLDELEDDEPANPRLQRTAARPRGRAGRR